MRTVWRGHQQRLLHTVSTQSLIGRQAGRQASQAINKGTKACCISCRELQELQKLEGEVEKLEAAQAETSAKLEQLLASGQPTNGQGSVQDVSTQLAEVRNVSQAACLLQLAVQQDQYPYDASSACGV